MHQDSPLLLILSTLWHSLHRHYSASASLPPSTPNNPYSAQQVCPRVQTTSTLSDPLYTLTFFSIPALPQTTSCLTLSIRFTHTILFKHLILRTFTLLVSGTFHTPVSVPCSALVQLLPHKDTFIPNPPFLDTDFSTPHELCFSFILCITSISHPPSATTCDIQILKTIYIQKRFAI